MQRFSQDLPHKRVPIRDGVSILEALGGAAFVTDNKVQWTEYVRQALRRVVVNPYANPSGDPPASLLDPTTLEHTNHLNPAPQRMREVQARITRAEGPAETPFVALASSGSRHFPRQFVEAAMGNLIFLFHNEISPGLKVVGLGFIQ